MKPSIKSDANTGMRFNPSGKAEENKGIAHLDAGYMVAVEAEKCNVTELFKKRLHVERCNVQSLILVYGLDWLKRDDRIRVKTNAHLQFGILRKEFLEPIPNVVTCD